MSQAVRITLIVVGFILAGFGLGFMLEGLVGGSDSGAPPAGALLGLGLGVVVSGVIARSGREPSA
jgi:hypothetical protein